MSRSYPSRMPGVLGAVVMTIALAAGGCAGDAALTPGLGEASGSSAPRTRPGGLVPGLDRGLRSWQWRIAEEELRAPLGDILASVAVTPPDAAVIDPEVLDRLARNGLRLLAVPREDIERLRTLIDAPAMQVETWHGEATDWRALAIAQPPGRGAALAVGDRVLRYPAGSFRLATRAWTMRMEDGPHLQIEVRVDHVEARRDRGLLAGRSRPVRRLIDGLVIELAAPPELAWVIVPAPADEQWPEPGTDVVLGDAIPRATTEAPRDLSGMTVPVADGRTIGPPSSRIMTVGELLLDRPSEPGVRELVILQPELPAALFPDAPSAADAAGEADLVG